MLSESQEGKGQHSTADGSPARSYKSPAPFTFVRPVMTVERSERWLSRALNPGAAAEKTGESNVYFCSKEQMKLFCHRDLASAGGQCNFLLSQ